MSIPADKLAKQGDYVNGVAGYLKFLGWLSMLCGLGLGIALIIMMGPPKDILGDPIGPSNPARWVYGIGIIIAGLTNGCAILGFASIVEDVHMIRKKVQH